MQANGPGAKTPTNSHLSTWRRTLAAALLAVLAACGGGSTEPADPVLPLTPTGGVSGVVVASNTGAPLSGVAVSTLGRSTTTAADGNYTLTEVPTGDANVITFELAGHARSVVAVAVAASAATRADARLTPVGTTQDFDAAAAATIAVAGTPAQVVLPAAGLVTASGATATGQVTAEVTPINPATDAANMPGNYTAQAAGGGAPQPIESFGALAVTLKDARGNALNLAPGKTATIRIPLATRSTSGPATVPLFHLDETTGLWVEEGTATLAGSAPNQYYEGTVSHFSYWNADRPTETIRVIGCVKDDQGANVAGAEVTGYGSDYSGSDSVTSNVNCDFAVAIRKGGVANIVAHVGNRSSSPARVGPSQVDIVLTGALALSAAGAPPLIVEQPQSQAVQVDTYGAFHVEAVGSPVLRYQWQRNGVDIADQTTPYLYVYPARASDDAASFRAVVTNAYGSATSDAAVLTVNTAPLPPLITGQPHSKSVLAGASATFDVVAVSQGGTLSYQWRRNGGPINGATGTSYTTPPTVPGDNGSSFSVLVTSSNGTSVSSFGATLTVGVPTPLAITTQPQDVTVAVGQGASFSVTVTGGATAPSYQWRRNGADIAGANAVSYTTPAAALSDSGSLFSVVVASGNESLTSTNAALTVTPPVVGNRTWLLASTGPIATGTIAFANGVQAVPTQAVVAVDTAAPSSTPVTVEPVGQTRFLFSSVVEGTISGNQVSNMHSRFGTYLKGGRLYKVDQVVANGAVPTPQVVSALTTTQVCGDSGMAQSPVYANGNDFLAPPASWVFMRGPGADALCETADDNYWAVRLTMAGTDLARTLPGEPQVDILAANGGYAGVVVRAGNEMRRSDADINNVNTLLFTIDPATYTNLGRVFGSALPGYWLFIEGGKLWGVNLAAPATRVALATLAAGEAPSPVIVPDGSSAFVGLSTSTDARVLRVDENLTATTVATLSQPLTSMAVTGTRLVMQTQGSPARLLSVDKAGGPTTTLLTVGAGVIPGVLLTSGENVYLAQYVFGANGSAASTLIVGADGSNPVTLVNTDIKRPVAAAVAPLAIGPSRTYEVILIDGVNSITSNAGGTLRAVNGATRAIIVTYGALPASPDGPLYPATTDPLQYGQSGLFTFFDIATGAADLYWFKSDAAGLIHVPH
jgi:hypothetical protein